MKKLFALLATLACAMTGWGFAYITNSGTGLPIKWPPGFVDISIMLGSTPTLQDGTNYNTSAQTAAQLWNAQLGSLQIRSTITTGTPGDHNHVNELAFAGNIFGQSFDATTLAVTTTWRSGNDRTEGDIIFNSAKTWNSYDGPLQGSTLDLQRVALHELGHLLGLDHPDEANPQQFVQAVMNSHISGQDTLAADDITGAQNLYGPPGIPANDDFAHAAAITLNSSNSATVTGYNTNATKQPGEPNHAGNAGGHSVWWKWTAPAAGSVTVDTGKLDSTTGRVDIGGGKSSYFDTTLGVYTGASVSSLTTIASNDDITPGVAQVSTVTFNATAGTTYFIAVDGFYVAPDADSGGITLNVNQTPIGGTLPTITTQPASVTTTVGLNPAFSVTATAGTSPITYQWLFNNTAISGATGATLNLNNVQTANAGSYFVTVSTNAGSVNSSTATLTVNAAVVVTPPPPTTPTPVSSGGGGGGGAPSEWFLLALGLLVVARAVFPPRPKAQVPH